MYEAILSTGERIIGITARDVWYAVDHSRRLHAFANEGLPGVTIYSKSGKVLYQQVRGWDMPLEEVNPSYRLYFCLKRRMADLGLESENATVGDVYEMALRGELRGMRLAGRTTYDELFTCLLHYVGEDTDIWAEMWSCYPNRSRIKSIYFDGYSVKAEY